MPCTHRRTWPHPAGRAALLLLTPLTLTLAGCAQQNSDPADPDLTSIAATSATTTAPAALTEPTENGTPSMTENDDTAAIMAVARDRNRGMIDRDTALLDRVLADDFTAIHITGYEQTKQEWLDQITSGEMQYHGIREIDSEVRIDGDTAVAVTRNAVDATIGGSRNTWNLQSTTSYERRDGSWTIVASESRTF